MDKQTELGKFIETLHDKKASKVIKKLYPVAKDLIIRVKKLDNKIKDMTEGERNNIIEHLSHILCTIHLDTIEELEVIRQLLRRMQRK